ncbi:DUF3261 domain-containing protein [Phytohalomonas tamaricis]|uniref:DUF3261 domain-containing protein n=1 Tax=Phytohalomonas tamaricis TaxID=2081032 RepID=UPI000D0BDA3A|nr:DUF3261 domain-containing protein [Phytohalomonas tamaricis]
MTLRLSWMCLAAMLMLGVISLGGCVGPSIAPTPKLTHPEAPQTLTRLLNFEPIKAESEPPQTLLAVIRLADDQLRVVIAMPTGQRLLTLVHDDQGARFTQQLMDPPFPAAWLATRLEWGLWPYTALATAWQGSEWRIVSSAPSQANARQTRGDRDIYHGDTLMAHLDYRADGSVLLIDHEGGYRLTISPL